MNTPTPPNRRAYRSPDAPGLYVATQDFRPPRKGEFYLSGAKVCAYRAPNDLDTAYRIARLCPGSDSVAPQPRAMF